MNKHAMNERGRPHAHTARPLLLPERVHRDGDKVIVHLQLHVHGVEQRHWVAVGQTGQLAAGEGGGLHTANTCQLCNTLPSAARTSPATRFMACLVSCTVFAYTRATRGTCFGTVLQKQEGCKEAHSLLTPSIKGV